MNGQTWMKPLRAQGLFSVEDIGVVFSNVEQLRMLNEELLTSLQGVEELPAAEQDVGRRFARFVDFLKMYFEYCANQAAAIERLQELKKAKPQLQQVLEVPHTHTHDRTHQTDEQTNKTGNQEQAGVQPARPGELSDQADAA